MKKELFLVIVIFIYSFIYCKCYISILEKEDVPGERREKSNKPRNKGAKVLHYKLRISA